MHMPRTINITCGARDSNGYCTGNSTGSGGGRGDPSGSQGASSSGAYPSNNRDHGHGGGHSGGGHSGGSSNHSNVQSIPKSLAPVLKRLAPDEWSLGMYTASLSGRKSKDTDGISNQAKGCFDYIKHNGNGSVSIDKLRFFTLRDSDLTEIDMVYFSNEMAPYSARFNYLDFSYNRINDSGIFCLFNNAFIPTGTYAKHVVSLNLSNNNLGNDSAIIISNAIANGQLTATRAIDVSGNKITQNGWESFAAAVKKVQVNTIVIKVAAADTLQGMKEFLVKGFKYYTQTHKVVVTKEFQDELLGANTSACEKTKNNVLKAAYTAGFIKSLTNGNDYFILAAGVEAGAGALLSQDTIDCYKQCMGDVQKWFNDVE